MPFRLIFSPTAQANLSELERLDQKKLKRVRKCLGMLETNPKHSGLNSHRYEAYDALYGERRCGSPYVENTRQAPIDSSGPTAPARTNSASTR